MRRGSGVRGHGCERSAAVKKKRRAGDKRPRRVRRRRQDGAGGPELERACRQSGASTSVPLAQQKQQVRVRWEERTRPSTEADTMSALARALASATSDSPLLTPRRSLGTPLASYILAQSDRSSIARLPFAVSRTRESATGQAPRTASSWPESWFLEWPDQTALRVSAACMHRS